MSVNWIHGMSADLLQQPDGTVRGTVEDKAATGLVEGNRLTLNSSNAAYTLKVESDIMTGTYTYIFGDGLEGGSQAVSLTRISQ